MNLFGRKFTPSKAEPRRTVSLNSLRRNQQSKSREEISNDFDKIRINFGNSKAKFKNGEWITDFNSNSDKNKSKIIENDDQIEAIKNDLTETRKENNLLKLKLEILLDMLTEKSAENLLNKKEITKLKQLNSR